MADFSQEEENMLKALFDKFDKDKSGGLDVIELQKLAQQFSLNPTVAEVKAVIEACDSKDEKDGILSFDELKTIVAALKKSPEEIKTEIEEALTTLLKHAGLQEDELTKDKFYKMQKKKGEDPLTKEDVKEIFTLLEKTGDTDTVTKTEVATLFSS